MRVPRRGEARVLPALKGERVRLLAWTYLDAAEGCAGAGGTRGRMESGMPSRDGYYWTRGSYKELERALDMLRATDRPLYRQVWHQHVGKLTWKSSAGLAELEALMPAPLRNQPEARGKGWAVPMMVAKSAGYLEAEAKLWAAPWDDGE